MPTGTLGDVTFHFTDDKGLTWKHVGKPIANNVKISEDGLGLSVSAAITYDWKFKPGYQIKKVIFSGDCTIVLWKDGTKTIVRCHDEEFDPEKGLAMALVKKAYGTNASQSNYCDIFKKWIPETLLPNGETTLMEEDK